VTVPGQLQPAGPPSPPYPVRLEFQRQAEYNRLLPLVKWLLAIPHYIVLSLLGVAAFFAVIGAFFAVLFTGRYPRGLFDFLVGVYRWSIRVTAYVYLMTDRYPPFTLSAQPDEPVQLEVEYPEAGIDRWRPLVHWLLILPYAFVVSILSNLAALFAFFALFTILFTKKFQAGMFDIVVVALRWQTRAFAYAFWMVDKYPPLVWA